MQHFFNVLRFEFHLCFISLIISQSFRTLVKCHTPSGFSKEDGNDGKKRHIGKALDSFNPPPADRFVDETGVDRSCHRSQDGNV